MPTHGVVLVTGASSGIGRACVEAFVAEGARVIAAARRGDRLEELREGREDVVLPLTVDVRDRAEVTAALAGLPPDWTPIDVLVNNAGLAAGLVSVTGLGDALATTGAAVTVSRPST